MAKTLGVALLPIVLLDDFHRFAHVTGDLEDSKPIPQRIGGIEVPKAEMEYFSPHALRSTAASLSAAVGR